MAEHLSSNGFDFKSETGECQKIIGDETFNNMNNSTIYEKNYDKEQHMCNKCSKSFPLKSELDNHIKKVHSIQCKRGFASSTLVCDVFGKNFTKKKRFT